MEAPEITDVAALLARLPTLAKGLSDAPQAELRELFEKLQLTIAYQPEDQALEVEITLYQDAWNESEGQPHNRAEDWMAPPAGLEPATVRLEGGCSGPLSYGGSRRERTGATGRATGTV